MNAIDPDPTPSNPDAREPREATSPAPGWLRGRNLLFAAGGLILAVVAVRACRSGTRGAGDARAARPVPVVVAPVRVADFQVRLSGLGTVTPLNTVTVRSRVDGQILRVAFTEGQFVHEGDLLVEIDPRPFQVQLTQAEGQRAKDEAALKNAKADLQRFRTLLDQGILARQQVDTQTATVDQFEAALRSDQGQVESAKLNLAYSRITAPISGRAGLRAVDAGNMVRASDPSGLLTLTQIQPITVLFTIPADAIPQVSDALRSGRRLQALAYDRDGTTRLAAGTLLALDNQIDPATGTLRLKALFPNEDGALFPNQFVNVRLQVDTLKAATLAPAAAIQRNAQSTFVYVLNRADGTVELRPVEVRATEGDDAVIAKGLAEGEQVVVEGIEKLKPGAKVSTDAPGAGPGKARP
ncbi:MAG: MdtA/MuxA family multidrug efflux RND transporter periplasmic adaptor subunit [Holophagaceae bacterium]